MGTKFHQFFMSKDSCRYVFKTGKIAVFEGGRYLTTDPKEIQELDDEIAAGIGAIYRDKDALIVDADDIDPVAVFKRKVIQEYLENQKRAENNGESSSDISGGLGTPGSNVGMANSKTIAPIAAGSQAGAAKAVPAGSIRLSK